VSDARDLREGHLTHSTLVLSWHQHYLGLEIGWLTDSVDFGGSPRSGLFHPTRPLDLSTSLGDPRYSCLDHPSRRDQTAADKYASPASRSLTLVLV
jgi:hypothetical protein